MWVTVIVACRGRSVRVAEAPLSGSPCAQFECRYEDCVAGGNRCRRLERCGHEVVLV